jgi:hypothetical protein
VAVKSFIRLGQEWPLYIEEYRKYETKYESNVKMELAHQNKSKGLCYKTFTVVTVVVLY